MKNNFKLPVSILCVIGAFFAGSVHAVQRYNFEGNTFSADTFIGRLTNNGGALAPGNAVGTSTIEGDLDFNRGTLQIEINETGADFLHVTGEASFAAGTLAISFLDGFRPTSGSSWSFLTADGGIERWQNLGLSVAGLNSSYSWFVSEANNGRTFNVTAIPEPEIYAMMGLGLGLMGFIVLRRKRQAA